MSSADSVSSRRGSARGRPVVFVRGRFIRRDDAAALGRDLLGIDGELDGEADMRVSMSVPSSSDFRFLLDMMVGGEEYAAGLLAEGRCSVGRLRTSVVWKEVRSEETRRLRRQDAVHRCSIDGGDGSDCQAAVRAALSVFGGAGGCCGCCSLEEEGGWL
jgi:hypothetical protein